MAEPSFAPSGSISSSPLAPVAGERVRVRGRRTASQRYLRIRFVVSLALLSFAGCAGFQDIRTERLEPTEIQQLQSQRVKPEDLGLNVIRSGSEVVAYKNPTWTDGTAVSTVPMINALDRGDTHAIVDAVLNEQLHVPMIVDTGAEADVLSPSLVQALGLPLVNTGNKTIVISGIGGAQPAFPAEVSNLRLGTVAVRNVLALVQTEQKREYTLGFFRSGSLHSGILGLNTLGRFRWITFDWHRRTISFGRQGDFRADPKKLVDEIPFRLDRGKLVLQGEVYEARRSVPVEFALDTGADDGVLLPGSVLPRLVGNAPIGPSGQRWVTGLGGYYVGTPFRIGYARIGKTQFMRPTGHTVPNTWRPLFGNKLMRYYKTTFDFVHMKLVFEKF